MGDVDELLANNSCFAASHPPTRLAQQPTRKLAVLACMDARVEPMALLGLHAGEAHVIRNAGGVVTDDVIRSLAISQRRLGTEVVMVIQHTDCGMQTITNAGFSSELQQLAGVPPPFAIEAFDDLDASVCGSIARVRNSPFLTDAVRGFVYDVDTHRLREVGVSHDSLADPAA